MYERLEADIKAALLSGDKKKAQALQFIKSSLLTASKDQSVDLANDQNVVTLLRKEAKKRLEAADLFTKGGNTSAAEKERSEEALIATYLPPQQSEEAIKEAIVLIIERDNLSRNMASMGVLISTAKKELGDTADPSVIARIATQLLKN